MQKLGTTLEPCQREVLQQAPCQRSDADLAPVLVLLQYIPLFAPLCSEAQRCIAAHAKLLELTDGVEMPRHNEDNQQLYAVLEGPVLLLHGDPNEAQLQQYLLQTQRHVSCNSLQMLTSTITTADPTLATSSTAAYDHSSVAGASAPSCGPWHHVRAIVSAGQMHTARRGMQANLNRGDVTSRSLTPVMSQQLQELDQERAACAEVVQGDASVTAGDPLHNIVRIQSVETGATFCGYQFPTAPPTVFTAAAGYSGDDAPQLSQLPNSCLAAIAEPNSTATLLTLSKPAYMEAMRLQHECHVSRLMDMMCRIPCLRHTPVKELHKLAAHMKEAKYEPGQVLLQQGKEVKEVHFLVSGTVQITYSPSLVAQQYRASMDTAAAAEVAAGSAAAAVGGKLGVETTAVTSQTNIIPPQVLGTRGPGCVLDDDAMRERRLAVGVVAATTTVTLKVAPQKLLCVLDPLTLRLFGRLRQQQPQAQQQVLQEAHSEANHQEDQQPVSQQLRCLALDQAGESMGHTHKHQKLMQETANHNNRPPWHSIRGKLSLESTTSGINDNSRRSLCQSPNSKAGCRQHCRGPEEQVLWHGRTKAATDSSKHVEPEDDIEAWKEALPKGLTLDKCVGLAHSTSVTQLIGLVKDIELSKTKQLDRQHHSPTLTASVSTRDSATLGSTSLTAHGKGDLSTTTFTEQLGGSLHTELLESCGVAVLQLKVLPGQAPVSAAAFAGVLDDIAAAWSAVTHDEGLQLIRWTTCRWFIIADLEPGMSKRSGLEGLAGAVLSAAMHLSGVVARSSDVLPVVGLAAGVASGSCFMQFKAGNFLHSISGRAYKAASELCSEAAVTSVTMHPSRQSSSKSNSHITIKVSDGVAATLQTNYCLEACSGGSFLVSAKPVLSSPTGSRPVSPENARASLPRNTLGPGRNTGHANGVMTLSPVTPRTPGGGLLLPNWGKAQNDRRQMRRKFEALQDLLAGGGDVLPPPPESMLTQPPPVAGGPGSWRISHASGTSGTGSYPGSVARSGTPDKQGRVTILSSDAGTSSGSQRSWSGSGRAKPKLTISVDGANPAELPDVAGAAAGSSTSAAADGRPQSAGSIGSLAADDGGPESADANPRALLTPTLVMDRSPWSLLQQQSRPASAEKKGILRSSADDNNRCLPSRGQRQLANVPLQNNRQSFKQKVLQEVEDMRFEAAECTRHAVGHRVVNNRATARVLPAAANGNLEPNSSSSDGKVTSSSRFASLTGGRAYAGSEQKDSGRPRSAGVLLNGITEKFSSNGGKLRVTFQTPKGQRHSSVVNSSRVSSMNSAGGCSDGSGVQQPGTVQQSGRQSLLRQPCGDVQYGIGADALSLPKGTDGCLKGVTPTLASKSSMLRSSMEAGARGVSQQQQQEQQQQQLALECSESESLNSLPLFTEAALANSNSSKGEAAAVHRQLLEAQRQQLLVMSACKALGSCAAAKSYVAALPEGLMTVNMSAAGLAHLPSLSRLTQLEQLSASFNKLDSLPELIPASATTAGAAADAAADASTSSQQRTLELLTQQLLSGQASALPTSIRRLGLAHNQLTQVAPEVPAALPGLTHLDLAHNQLSGLPATFGSLSCLKTLLLANNNITALPGSFTRLYSLQTLDMCHNQLTQLPNSFDQLSALTSLQLQHNPLHVLPPELAMLSGLKSLGLGYIGLGTLPVEILRRLPGLTSLDLSGNGLQDVTAGGVMSISNHEGAGLAAEPLVLDKAYANACGTNPSDGGKGDGVQQSAVALVAPAAEPQAHAHISEAVPTAGSSSCVLLPALQALDLSINHLQQLPSWLPSSLRHLSASNNQITNISNDLCSRLSGLIVLDLHNNSLLDLPQAVTSMEHLQILALGENPGLDCESVAAQAENAGTTGASPSERSIYSKDGEYAGHSQRVNSAKSDKGGYQTGKGGMLWVYKMMMQRKAAAAAELARIAQQQRQQRQQAQQRQQVTGSLLKGLLPGIRQTVIIESGRAM